MRREILVAAAILLDSRGRVLLVGNDWGRRGRVRYTLPGGTVEPGETAVEGGGPGEVDFSDPLLKKAAEIVVEEGYGSVSRLQRRLSIGHARAGKLMDALEAMGIVGPPRGSKPREVLVTKDQLKDFFG